MTNDYVLEAMNIRKEINDKIDRLEWIYYNLGKERGSKK